MPCGCCNQPKWQYMAFSWVRLSQRTKRWKNIYKHDMPNKDHLQHKQTQQDYCHTQSWPQHEVNWNIKQLNKNIKGILFDIDKYLLCWEALSTCQYEGDV
jgi:hypothetical protein